MNQWQQMEVDIVEKEIMIILFGQTAIPEKTAVLLNSLKINPNEYIQKFEKRIVPVLERDGRVNGKLLRAMLKAWKPDLLETFNIPVTNFRMIDVVRPTLAILFPGRKNVEKL